MRYYLTSSPFLPDSPDLNPDHDFADILLNDLKKPCRGLFVTADPRCVAPYERFAEDMMGAMKRAGVPLTGYDVLDGRNASLTAELVSGAGVIVFAGGHVPTQNAFLKRVGMKEKLRGYDGLIIGISAGSMNCADVVYAIPELDGESISQDYNRYPTGLGITRTMIIPHYQKLSETVLDGKSLILDIAAGDSRNKEFIALCDGSWIEGGDGAETVHGPAWRIADGNIEPFGENRITGRICT